MSAKHDAPRGYVEMEKDDAAWAAIAALPDAPRGLHACVGCGLELDGDDLDDRCEDCGGDT